jgi:hypothetical protein
VRVVVLGKQLAAAGDARPRLAAFHALPGWAGRHVRGHTRLPRQIDVVRRMTGLPTLPLRLRKPWSFVPRSGPTRDEHWVAWQLLGL